jgi:hypothetical protein
MLNLGNLKIDPKISIPLIREWQKIESSDKKKAFIKNPKLESFLTFHRSQIEKYGLEFPTEYIIIGKK